MLTMVGVGLIASRLQAPASFLVLLLCLGLPASKLE